MVASRPELRAVPQVVVSLIGAAIRQGRSPGLGVVLTMAVAPIAPLGCQGKIAAQVRPQGPVMARALVARANRI